MIDFNKIKKLNEKIKKNKERLRIETQFDKKEILNYKIKIDQLAIKIERLKQ
ncbi:MAG: hypothetical protein ACI9FW_001295 [Flavobacterium sp.]|jgi:hypothetical protein